MLNFITIVLAIVAAQVLLMVGMMAVLTNKKVMKAYMKWVMGVVEDLYENPYLEDKEEL